MKEIKVVELFAGVGGFRVGLERASKKYKVVFSNQWEPSTKSQDASDIYVARFGEDGHICDNIEKVASKDIPVHNLLVGGFPCQDYSVARTLNQSAGLQGKKGVLWWQIHRIIKEKRTKPELLFLENVDRLLKSPVKQRGRDFAIMLASLSDLGYIVEWRVINAADYGMPQRRRRVFLLGYHKSSNIFKEVKSLKDKKLWLTNKGLFAKTFEIQNLREEQIKQFKIDGDLNDITETFNVLMAGSESPFGNAGLMVDRKIWTADVKSNYDGPSIVLGDVVEKSAPKEFYIEEDSLPKWEYFKGGKKEKRVDKQTGFEYHYSEGGMIFPDPLDKPSRTIITGEGGSSPSRFKHVVRDSTGKLRRLMPIELERLNMFPDNHTKGATDIKRAFFMGNALVVGVIEAVGKEIARRVK